MNEAQGYRLHSNLTPKEQREAMESLYYGGPMSPNEMSLSYEERVKLRRLLDDQDRREAGGAKEFDLAKPPVPAYQFREFPFLMYNHETRKTKTAHNHEEREALMAQGWRIEPFPSAGQEVQLTAAEREEASRLDRLMKMPKEEFEAMMAPGEKKGKAK